MVEEASGGRVSFLATCPEPNSGLGSEELWVSPSGESGQMVPCLLKRAPRGQGQGSEGPGVVPPSPEQPWKLPSGPRRKSVRWRDKNGEMGWHGSWRACRVQQKGCLRAAGGQGASAGAEASVPPRWTQGSAS